MALLGDDGRGFDLARKLEAQGVWRQWLGDSIYSTFVPFLSSPAAWEAFMRTDAPKPRAQIHLQLRARALLFDKASVSLFLRSNSSSPSSSLSNSLSSSLLAVSKLNPSYLQLHGDDVYYTLENQSQDGVQQREGGVSSNTVPSKIQSKAASSFGQRYKESAIDNASQRVKSDEFLETWYNQFIERYRANKPYRLSFGNRESDKRSSEDMSAYIRILEKHKKRRIAFTEDQHRNVGNTILENASNSNSGDDDTTFFPETMFTLNCVPDTALPLTYRAEDNQKLEFYGVLDTLPPIMTRSPVMIERLGIRADYLNMERGSSIYRGKNGSVGNRRSLSKEQAMQMSQKVIARMLANVGFEGASEVPMEVFSQLMSCHIGKLGSNLKVLTDSYRKQCSAIELLKMFIKTMGYSHLGPLMEHIKDGSRNIVQQPQPQLHAIQSQVQLQHQNPLQMTQQITRQMHPQGPQMQQQILHPHTLTPQQQQQLERVRRRQAPACSTMDMSNKDRPLVQVKLEQPSELPLDGGNNNNNAFALNQRQAQFQLRQQQIAAMSNFLAQPGNQYRQIASPQIPQVQTPNMGVVRAPPVKVEGFQELMGGDTTSKHDSEDICRLTSPSK